MDTLTLNEVKVLNQVSQARHPHVDLGTKLQTVIGEVNGISGTGTPVNARSAAVVMTITGVVKHGEKITVDNPLLAGSDVYEFLSDTEQTKSSPNNIAVDITAYTTKSTGTLTVDTQPTSGDTITIGTKVYTFVPVGTNNADGEIPVGANLAGAQSAIVVAINGTDGVNTPHPGVRIDEFSANAATVTALVGGTAGDLIATTETFTAETNVFAAATLGSGADCTAKNATVAIATISVNADTQRIFIFDGETEGGDATLAVIAQVAGVSGDNIIVGETLANGAFAGGATKLSGGVNGTIGKANQILNNNTYLYVCVADNSVSDQNWRRISLGVMY